MKIHKLFQKDFLLYLFVAGGATVVDVITFGIVTAMLLPSVFYIGSYSIEQKTAGLIISFSVGLLTNFLLSKKFVFKQSSLSTQTQFLRFVFVAILIFGANWLLMDWLFILLPPLLPLTGISLKLLIRFIAAGIVAVLSFISHKLFSFAVKVE